MPRIEGLLLSGDVRLSTVAMAAAELDEGVLDEIRGKTQREVQEVLARLGKVPRQADRLRAVGDGWEFRFAAGQALRDKFERARALLSKKHPEGIAFETVFEAMADAYLERHDPGSPRGSDRRSRIAPGEQAPRGSARSPGGRGRRSRYIPTAVRRAVWRRDEGRCAYRSVDGRRCGSTWDVEVDPIDLFCRGGSHREDNLRLLCAAHNRRAAERSLGRRWMRQFC